ncbi:hypothetical protein EV182_000347 [Spiromyces aspiralis]|uniref:Uncharacterized protein n=1 Tax=Spiromyces aspiralis TaxID=68401 RepID=A0ACC1HJP7_9FUNG|nr:hypothetical protein EV182_000347 [Spiromyces aspiralis]
MAAGLCRDLPFNLKEKICCYISNHCETSTTDGLQILCLVSEEWRQAAIAAYFRNYQLPCYGSSIADVLSFNFELDHSTFIESLEISDLHLLDESRSLRRYTNLRRLTIKSHSTTDGRCLAQLAANSPALCDLSIPGSCMCRRHGQPDCIFHALGSVLGTRLVRLEVMRMDVRTLVCTNFHGLLPNLKSLKILSLDYRGLDWNAVEARCPLYPNLQTLVLQVAPGSELIRASWFPNLTELCLRYILLLFSQETPPCSTWFFDAPLSRLCILDISVCSLSLAKKLCVGCPNVEHLELCVGFLYYTSDSANLIDAIVETVINGFKQLNHLILKDNQLVPAWPANIRPSHIRWMPNILETLNIRNSKLSSFKSMIFLRPKALACLAQLENLRSLQAPFKSLGQTRSIVAKARLPFTPFSNVTRLVIWQKKDRPNLLRHFSELLTLFPTLRTCAYPFPVSLCEERFLSLMFPTVHFY